MIGLDTNILVRYLTQDHSIQSPKATEIIERRLTEENPGFVSIVAMVETVWVLNRAYRLAPREIAAAVERMLQTEIPHFCNSVCGAHRGPCDLISGPPRNSHSTRRNTSPRKLRPVNAWCFLLSTYCLLLYPGWTLRSKN
jgi:PIN domain